MCATACLSNPDEMLDVIEALLVHDKAEDVTIVNVGGKTSFADYMVIATGRSARQVSAMAAHLRKQLKARGVNVELEGLRECNWVILDAGDVVIHLFRPEVRAFYNLEKMWVHV
ncbi:Ribosomal silencing factor RsfA (former Iojap) [invertebrate metagenome]|uniref:Ribosomal silencing factor RsfA (Former Iojap) n=1 Tax=invertebrate metagenome TaxID=1711999 RepID=A0A484H528_9ZZZZ